jgi:cephalosporin hydroxylase
MRIVANDGMGGARVMPVPTLFQMARTPEGHIGFGTRWHYPDNTVVQVAATGAACLLIHRSAVEKVRAEDGDRWFEQKRYEDGRLLAEDLSFCYRLGAAGIPIFVHTGVKTTHHKQVWIGAGDYTQPIEPGPEPDVAPALPAFIDLPASFAALANNAHDHDGMLKFREDLARYEQIIAATRPDVVVETGTRTGASAEWFAEHGLDVVTVDINNLAPDGPRTHGRITYLRGSSGNPEVVARVAKLVAGRRVMVSLDSDHSAAHVAAEIGLYGPLVSPGCYLVVEDTIFAYAPPQLRQAHFPAGLDGSPLDAVAALLVDSPDWSRDIAIERSQPVSSNPAGWWVRNG